MPELPEVEYAARLARAASEGKALARVRVTHPAQRRLLPARVTARLRGEVVTRVERRGKHQLLHLAGGGLLLVHFRMTGEWRVGRVGDPPERFGRVALEFADGTRLTLDDSRALSVVSVVGEGVEPLPNLGPEATAPEFDGTWLRQHLARRRSAIKPALLDQQLVAGIGNIYASEALWYAGVDPRRPAHRLSAQRLAAVAAGVKRAMRRALDRPERYYGAGGVSDAVRFNVYDREDRPCRRCHAAIRRTTQAGRSTYWCNVCQT